MKTKQKHRDCIECGRKIPVERLAMLPETWTCVRCSDVRPYTEDDFLMDGQPDLTECVKSTETAWN